MRKEGEYDVFINSLKKKTNEILGINANKEDLIKYKNYLNTIIENELLDENLKYFNNTKIDLKLAKIMRFLILENYSEIVYEINDLFNYMLYNEFKTSVSIKLLLINLHLTLTKGLLDDSI